MTLFKYTILTKCGQKRKMNHRACVREVECLCNGKGAVVSSVCTMSPGPPPYRAGYTFGAYVCF